VYNAGGRTIKTKTHNDIVDNAQQKCYLFEFVSQTSVI